MAEKIPGFGGRLRAFMHKKGISARELGVATHTNGNSISLMLRGKNFMVDRLYKLRDAYPELDINYLLFGEEVQAQKEAPAGTAGLAPLHMSMGLMAARLQVALNSGNEVEARKWQALCEGTQQLAHAYAALAEEMLALMRANSGNG